MIRPIQDERKCYFLITQSSFVFFFRSSSLFAHLQCLIFIVSVSHFLHTYYFLWKSKEPTLETSHQGKKKKSSGKSISSIFYKCNDPHCHPDHCHLPICRVRGRLMHSHFAHCALFQWKMCTNWHLLDTKYQFMVLIQVTNICSRTSTSAHFVAFIYFALLDSNQKQSAIHTGSAARFITERRLVTSE